MGMVLRLVRCPLLLALSLFALLIPNAHLNADDAAIAAANPSTHYLWKPVAIGAGGFITGYRSDESGSTRVVRTDTYGAYIWRDGGGPSASGRWSQLVTSASMPAQYRNPRSLNAGVYEIAVAPSDPGRIYMVIKGLVFRSDDAGATFLKVANDIAALAADGNSPYRLYGPFMAVSPTDPDTLLLGTSQAGLLRSSDAGTSWSKVESVPDAADLDPNAEGIQAPGQSVMFVRDASGRELAYVAVPGHGLFISDDGGESFLPAAAEQERPLTIKQFIVDREARVVAVDQIGQSVWRYDGKSWTRLIGPKTLAASNFVSVAIDRDNGRLYVFEAFRAIYTSDDNGKSWWLLPMQVRTGANEPPWLAVSNMSFAIGQVSPDSVVKHRFWAAAGTGVYYADIDPDIDPEADPTKALPVTWTSQSRGIEQLVTNDVYHAPGRAPLFAVWDFGIHRKENLDRFSTGFGPVERMILSAQQVVGTPADPDFAVTNATDHRNCCYEQGAVQAGYSKDNGRSWTRFPSLPVPPGTAKDDPKPMAYGMIAISSSDVNNIVWAPSFNRAPFYTKDLGKTWHRVRFPGEQGDLTGSHADFYLPRRVLTADPVEGGTFYLVHSGNPDNAQLQGLWVTHDGGQNWTRVFKGEIAPASRYSARLRAVPGRQGDLFFTSQVDGNIDTRLRRTRDGGVSWSTIDEAEHIDDIAFGRPLEPSGAPTIFVSGSIKGEYGIWRSTDDAKSWQKIGRLPVGTLDQVVVMGGNPDVFGEVYIGYMGSGWIYGRPGPCDPKPYASGDSSECFESPHP